MVVASAAASGDAPAPSPAPQAEAAAPSLSPVSMHHKGGFSRRQLISTTVGAASAWVVAAGCPCCTGEAKASSDWDYSSECELTKRRTLTAGTTCGAECSLSRDCPDAPAPSCQQHLQQQHRNA